MHRKHVRATVDGVDIDIPISTFGALQYLYYNGEFITTAEIVLPENIVSGVPPTLDNAIARWDGVTGTLLQNSLVIISDTAQVTGVTALNGRDIARWTDGPAIGGATDSAVALWDTTTGRLLKNSVVTINDDGDITTPGDMNPTSIGTIPVGVLVRSSEPTTHVDNSVARWDGTTGNSLDDSLVVIDDLGNVTGVTTINTRDVSRWVDGPTPAVSVHGNITVWNGTSGRLVADSGLNVANLVYNLDSEVVSGHLPEFSDSAGRRITDSGIISDHVVTSAAVGADNRIARYDGAARAIQSSTVTIDDSGNTSGVGTLNTRTIANWVDGPASATDNAVARFDATTGKLIQNSVVTISDAGALAGVTTINGGTFVRSATGTTVNFEIALWQGTTGDAITASGILWNQVAYIGTTFGNDNRLVRTDTATNNRAVQQSGITIDDGNNITGVATIGGIDPANWVRGPASATNGNIPGFNGTTGKVVYDTGISALFGNLTGVVDITMTGTLNSRDPDDLVAGPASAVDNRIARFDATTGKLIQSSAVTIDDSGNITGSNLAVGIASATDNRLVRFDGTGGKQLQQSVVTLDDSGNITGAGTYNTVNVAAHATRHRPGGADSLFAASDYGDIYIHPEVAGNPMEPKYWSIGAVDSAGPLTTTYRQVMDSTFVTRNRASNALNGTIHAHAWIPYALGDTGSDIQIQVGWDGMTATAIATCGAQGYGTTVSGNTLTFDNSAAANSIPGAGIIHVFWSASSVPQGAYIYVFARSVGATHTLYLGGCEIYEGAR